MILWLLQVDDTVAVNISVILWLLAVNSWMITRLLQLDDNKAVTLG